MLKVTTHTNNHNSCMTIHILPYNFIICYHIYLKHTEINGIGLPDTKIMHLTFYIYQHELLPLFVILLLFWYGNCKKVSKSLTIWKLFFWNWIKAVSNHYYVKLYIKMCSVTFFYFIKHELLPLNMIIYIANWLEIQVSPITCSLRIRLQ